MADSGEKSKVFISYSRRDAAEFADERAYYRGQVGSVVGTADTKSKPGRIERNWTAGLAVYDISQPAEPRKIGFMPV